MRDLSHSKQFASKADHVDYVADDLRSDSLRFEGGLGKLCLHFVRQQYNRNTYHALRVERIVHETLD